MRRASLPGRLDRLAGRRGAVDLERAIRELAAETGLHPAEIRAELEAIEARIRRYGPETPERLVSRWAEELGLPEEELWDEVARITGVAGAAR